jgi:single-stranded-DNA-specific exonuclease
LGELLVYWKLQEKKMLAALKQAMSCAAAALSARPAKEITLFHHNDTDGLCSGAILLRAFTRAGYHVQRICLEKPYPGVLEKVFRDESRVLVFADFAGRIAPHLADLNRNRNLVLVLDHHATAPIQTPEPHGVYNLDPELYGLKGDRDISASVTCYLFASLLDGTNQDLAGLAVLGAVGDRFFEHGRLVGINGQVVKEAVDSGLLQVAADENEERYLLATHGGAPCRELSVYLDTLGAVGYYRGGPDLGLKVCLEGRSEAADRAHEELSRLRTEHFRREADTLEREGIRRSGHIQWFDLKNRFDPMGVKMVGIFCDHLKGRPFIRQDQYIAGFQALPAIVPGIGDIGGGEVKVSMRVPEPLAEKIRAGKAIGLSDLLPPATETLGGFSDACHSLSAATTISAGLEEQLIAAMEEILATRT